mmetsp:Transcript_77684/g.197389  ORF Transcript_77684/g.197389 Transcript_77684/m.197389 type:complete len:210 (-) Transcript_77684:606-1235(-)
MVSGMSNSASDSPISVLTSEPAWDKHADSATPAAAATLTGVSALCSTYTTRGTKAGAVAESCELKWMYAGASFFKCARSSPAFLAGVPPGRCRSLLGAGVFGATARTTTLVPGPHRTPCTCAAKREAAKLLSKVTKASPVDCPGKVLKPKTMESTPACSVIASNMASESNLFGKPSTCTWKELGANAGACGNSTGNCGKTGMGGESVFL